MAAISVIWKGNPPHFEFEITDLRKVHHFHVKFDEFSESEGIFIVWSILTKKKKKSMPNPKIKLLNA